MPQVRACSCADSTAGLRRKVDGGRSHEVGVILLGFRFILVKFFVVFIIQLRHPVTSFLHTNNARISRIVTAFVAMATFYFVEDGVDAQSSLRVGTATLVRLLLFMDIREGGFPQG